MSPNMQITKFFSGLRVLLMGLVKKLPKREPKKAHKHHLKSHAESCYIWVLLGKSASESQELIRDRNDRRTNGFNTVEMTIGEKEAKA